MTIYNYFFTFGFHVKIEYALTALRYTEDKLTPEIKETIRDELGLDDDIENNKYLKYWLEMDMMNGKEYFNIEEQKYVIRKYQHSDGDLTDYLVIGVETAKMDRFNGKIENYNMDGQKAIKSLVKSQEWINAIQKSDRNCTSYKLKDFHIVDPEYKNFGIAPSVYINADDCDCCS